jgi:hypothetical protein
LREKRFFAKAPQIANPIIIAGELWSQKRLLVHAT